MAIYTSAYRYIECVTDQEERIARLEQIIRALEDLALKAISTGDLDEYSLDDGQTKIRTKYRDVSAIQAQLRNFYQLKDTMIAGLNNKVNGRIVRLVDSKNFTGWN